MRQLTPDSPGPASAGRGAGAELTIGELLRVEDSGELLALRCPVTSIPLWAMIRFPFMRSVIGDLLFESPNVRRPAAPRTVRAMAGKLWTLGRAVSHNAAWLMKNGHGHPVVIMATGARMQNRDGLLFNALSDHFTGAYREHTVAVEHLFEWKWPFPRCHKATLIHTPYALKADVLGRRRAAALLPAAGEMVDLVAARARDILGWEIGAERRDWLVRACAGGAASLPVRYADYTSLLTRVGAKVLVKEEAIYAGPENAALMLAARHLGIRMAEYQHGLISQGHDSYNFADSIARHGGFADILPDDFLAYGSWWADQINAPVRKVPIGNPHRSERPARKGSRRQDDSVLVLSDGLDTPLYLRLCAALAASAPDRRVVFRPHPLDRSAVAARGLGDMQGLFDLDMNPDIYDSFDTAGAVVSELSTGLFEAIGLVPRVFLWNTAKARFCLPRHPFATFSDAQELAAKLADGRSGHLGQHEAQAFWAPDWRDNYLRYLAEVLH